MKHGLRLDVSCQPEQKDEADRLPRLSSSEESGDCVLLSGHGGKTRLAISTKSADLEDGPRQMMARSMLSFSQLVNVKL